MVYVCIKKFTLINYDEDGRSTEKLLTVRKGSKWTKQKDYKLGIQKISLENLSNSKWIEITEERFKEYFKEKEYNLILHVRKEYFNKIKNGEKKFEYRLFNDYWKKRLDNKEFDNVIIQLGYPKVSEKDKTLKFKYQGYKIEKIKHKEFGAKPVKVFAIKLQGE